jgi:hypothetical protein
LEASDTGSFSWKQVLLPTLLIAEASKKESSKECNDIAIILTCYLKQKTAT